MERNLLDMYREVQPDVCLTLVPSMSWSDEEVLNRQTGFNRSLLESSEECGCFHYGRRFPTSLVSSWMVELGEQDTGRCPYCGEDTLIVGTEKLPLSTALLTTLYLRWFETEYKERKKLATDTSKFKDYLDFLSEGVPFRWKTPATRKQLAEIGVWPVGDPGDGRYDCEGAEELGVYTDASLGGVWHLRAWEEDVDDGLTQEEVEQLDDEVFWNRVDVVEHYELVRGDEVVHFSPWSGEEQSLLQSLYEEYDDRLLAIFKDSDFSRLEVLVEDSAE